MKVKTIDYDQKESYTGNTENQIATDAPIEEKYGNPQRAYIEGFASAHGVRGETAETAGRVEHPDMGDQAKPDRVPDSIEEENPGLADN